MKVAFVSTGSPEFDDYPDPSHGTSVQIWKLAREMARRGHEVEIYYATFDAADSWTTDDGIRMFGITRPSVDDVVNGLFTKLIFSKRTANRLRESDPDVVYLRERTTAVFPVRLPIPTIYTVISPDACDYFFRYSVAHHKANLMLFPYKRLLEEYACRRADATIVMNEGMKMYFESKGVGSVHEVSIAIEAERFDGLDREVQNRLLYVGRFDFNKRPEWLLEAFAAVDTETELHFVGTGSTEDNLKARARALDVSDRVVFHGWLDRSTVLEFMADSKGLVLPSRYENSPNVVLEAMAAGCPVVASDTRGARSMIHHEETGLLFEKTCLSDLESNVSRLLGDDALRQRLGENGRRYALRDHSVERITDEYLAVFDEVRQ